MLVAFDGSPSGWTALYDAIAIARDSHSRLTIATVAPEPTVWMGPGPVVVPYSHESLRRDAEREAERQIAAARDEVPANVSVTTKILHGSPRRALADEAASGVYDLVVIGPRPASRLGRLLRRSVTRALLSHTDTSILAARPR